MFFERNKMSDLKKMWQEYLQVTSDNSKVKYDHVTVKKIEKKKSAWGGCCYAFDRLIGITNSSREVLTVDSVSNEIDIFGKTKIGTYKWTGGCNYKGKCYGFPRKENSILVIDYKNKEAYARKLDINYRGEHHYGGTFLPEGIVYQPPRNTNHILRIDLNTFGTKVFYMPGIDESCRYSASVLHPSGDIYFMPEFGYPMAVLHPDTGEIEYIGEKSDHLVFGMVIGVDGNIYGFSKEGNGILKVDVLERKVVFIHQEIGNPDCYGSVVGINGKIYGVPGSGNTIWEFDVNSQEIRKIADIEERGYAKCAGGGLGRDGSLVMMPCFGDCIYFLKHDEAFLADEKFTENIFFNTTY